MSLHAASRDVAPPNLLETAEPAEGVLRISLANPPANALSEALIAALSSALAGAAADRRVRVVILAAEGKVFSAGHDLKEMAAHRGDDDRGRAWFAHILSRCSELMLAIVRHPKPVIAEVAGLATAAGCQLVASCDLAVAGEAARFQTPGVNIGLFCSTPMVALSRNLHRKHAMEMLLTGEEIDAEAARRIGLVNRVVPAAELKDAALSLAQRIAAKPAATVKIGKEAFYAQAELPLGAAYDHAVRVMVENMLAGDAEEGIGAFLEKRRPRWSQN
jgi:enoyl-CoA hydratase/carnithine racemase